MLDFREITRFIYCRVFLVIITNALECFAVYTPA